MRGADSGAWFGGIQGRLFFTPIIALEASIEFHQSDFFDDDVQITQYPVQVTALLCPFPDEKIRPYVLGGAGWYYTRVTYTGAFGLQDSETNDQFGLHFGVGAEMTLGETSFINLDVRYVFLDEPGVDNSQVEDEEFDTWQISAGYNFKF